MNIAPHTTLGRLIIENEVRLMDDSFESEMGEVIYFDPFVDEWVSLGGR